MIVFSFKVRQHGQQQLYLQNGRYSFIFTTLLVHITSTTVSTKNPFLYFS